jgi:hypothetical protein
VSAVRLTTTLTRIDVAKVSFLMMVLHPLSLTMIGAGPVSLLLGLATHAVVFTRLGETMVWLVVLVPGFGLLAAMYNAYRPGNGVVFIPAQWTFSEEGVAIKQPGRDARASWGEFTKWRTAAGCLLLHTSPTRYVVIPWRDVPPGERPALEALLRRRLKSRQG